MTNFVFKFSIQKYHVFIMINRYYIIMVKSKEVFEHACIIFFKIHFYTKRSHVAKDVRYVLSLFDF